MGIIGILLGLVLLVIMAIRGYHILLTALVCALVVAILGGMNPYPAIMENYMAGYVGFFKSYLIMFLVGALFGKVMEESGGADAIANLVVQKLGAKYALLAIVVSCAVLAYGGVSVFVVMFTAYPIAVNLFKEANLPRKFLPAAIACGSVTFAMTSPGTPQIQNIIQSSSIDSNPMSGAVVGVICGAFMAVVGTAWLYRMVAVDVAKGGCYTARPGETLDIRDLSALPSPLLSFLPLVVTIVTLNIIKLPVEVAVLSGIVVGLIVFANKLNFKDFNGLFTRGAAGALSSLCNTCAVVGFGSVVKAIPAFQNVIDVVTNIPGPALIGAALAVTIICGITGSASGGLGIAMPIVGPVYTVMGISPHALHRVTAIASGALDSMPHNGYIVSLLNLCGVTHKDGYLPIFNITVVLPLVTTLLAIGLFQIFPNLP